ncbi:MAG: CoA-binding protein [Acidimicrobiia bacterium]|nr:CoA-binding protein [Acidimicrobiia bacterium]
MAPEELLRRASAILLVDWPSREVPDSLALAGYDVVASVGPGPEDYSDYVVEGGEVVSRHVGRPPERVEIVYAFRPVEELPAIVALAESVGAETVWCEARSDQARRIVDASGLTYVDTPRSSRRSPQRIGGLTARPRLVAARAPRPSIGRLTSLHEAARASWSTAEPTVTVGAQVDDVGSWATSTPGITA